MIGWASRDSVLPSGFGAYARIFHPGIRYWWEGPVNRAGSTRTSQQLIRWAGVAELTRSEAHPWMQWGGIAGVQMEEADLGDGTSVGAPEDGRLPQDVLEALLPLLSAATTTPDDITAAVWTGWGELRSVSFFTLSDSGHSTSGTRSGTELGVSAGVTRALDEGPLLQLPGREYLLLSGALTDLADPHWAVEAGLGTGLGDGGVAAPQLLRPADSAWCLATEIDFGFTLLGGPASLVEQVLAKPDLEAMPLDHDGALHWDGDTINPTARDRT